MAYKVRRLKTKDLFRFANILGKVTEDASESLQQSMQQQITQIQEDATASVELSTGMALVEAALRHAESDLKAFFADLVDMTPEEFDDEPFDATVDILETLIEQEDLASFFKRASGMMQNMSAAFSGEE